MAENVKVFCSHSSADKPRVRAIAEQLAAAGIDAWVDQWEIAPGDDIVGVGWADAGSPTSQSYRKVRVADWTAPLTAS